MLHIVNLCLYRFYCLRSIHPLCIQLGLKCENKVIFVCYYVHTFILIFTSDQLSEELAVQVSKVSSNICRTQPAMHLSCSYVWLSGGNMQKPFCLVSNFTFRERDSMDKILFPDDVRSTSFRSAKQPVSASVSVTFWVLWEAFFLPVYLNLSLCQMYGNLSHLQKLNSFEDYVHRSLKVIEAVECWVHIII